MKPGEKLNNYITPIQNSVWQSSDVMTNVFFPHKSEVYKSLKLLSCLSVAHAVLLHFNAVLFRHPKDLKVPNRASQ